MSTQATDLKEDLPAELERWNWGAFFLNWIWGIGNNTYSALKVFIPIYGFYFVFQLGLRGNALAWKNGNWESVEHFRRVQRKWAIAGSTLVSLWILLLFPIFFFVAGILKDSEAFTLTVSELERSESFGRFVGRPYDIGFVTGELHTTGGGNGSASLSFRIDGPNGEARIFSAATREFGVWSVRCIRATYENDGSEEWIGEC